MRLLISSITMSTSPIFYFHRFQTIVFGRFIHYYYILTHPFSINDVLLRDNFALTIMLINDSRAHVGTVQLLVAGIFSLFPPTSDQETFVFLGLEQYL